MSGSELGAIVVGLLFGYWIISAFLSKKGSKRPAPSNGGGQREDPSQEHRQQQQFQPPGDEYRAHVWYEVLGLPAAASSEEIRAAYRSQIGKYHPDKVDSLGAEIKLVAERKTKEIVAAYREGMRGHGIEV